MSTRPEPQLPHVMTFVMSFFLLGPFILYWLIFLIEGLSGRFKPLLLLGGFAWFIVAAFAPFAAPLLIFAAPVAGLILWATLRYLLRRVPSLKSNRWLLIATSAALSALISAVVASAATHIVLAARETPSALSVIRSALVFAAIVAPIGGILGALLALFIRPPGHLPDVFFSNRVR